MQQKAGRAVGHRRSWISKPTETAPVVSFTLIRAGLPQGGPVGMDRRRCRGFAVSRASRFQPRRQSWSIKGSPLSSAVELAAITSMPSASSSLMASMPDSSGSSAPSACTGSPGVVTGWLRGHQCLPDLLGVVVLPRLKALKPRQNCWRALRGSGSCASGMALSHVSALSHRPASKASRARSHCSCQLAGSSGQRCSTASPPSPPAGGPVLRPHPRMPFARTWATHRAGQGRDAARSAGLRPRRFLAVWMIVGEFRHVSLLTGLTARDFPAAGCGRSRGLAQEQGVPCRQSSAALPSPSWARRRPAVGAPVVSCQPPVIVPQA